MSAAPVLVRILGEVRCVAGGIDVDVPSSTQRRLLAALAVYAPRPVRSEWLCAIMDLTPGALRQSVARLRRSIGESTLRTSATGYQLVASLDSALAEADFARAGNDPEAVAVVLARWDGPSIVEFADEPWAVGSASRLDELRATIVEAHGAALIDHERFDEAIGVLEAHVVDHPFRDHPRGLLIRALAAAGRRTEALRVSSDYRRFLGSEVGVEPSAQLQEVEQRVACGWDGRNSEVGWKPAVLPDSGSSGRKTWPNPLPLPEALAATAPCVGRRNELTVLTQIADRVAADGRLGVALVSGEAGIGKSTLAAEFARTYGRDGDRSVWFGRSDELATEPLQPFRSVLSQLAAALPDDVISVHTAACGGDLLPAVPHQQHRWTSPAAGRSGGEVTSRLLLFEAACDLFRRAAELSPMIVVIDDLHWAEPAGLQLLRHLVRNLTGSRVLFVVCFRDTGEADGDDIRSALAELSRGSSVRIELSGLASSELGDLARTRHDALAECDVGEVAGMLRAESAGNPLFAEQLLRHYSASGLLRVDDGVAVVDRRQTDVVPASLRDLVWHRARSLGAWGQPVLAAAAVIGPDVEVSVLEAMIDIDSDELASVLDRVVAAGLLVDDAAVPGRLRFAHELVARSVVDDLGSRERARLHERAFETLLVSPSVQPARLAYHADRAGLVGRALHWSVRAGERALDDLTPDEAAAWFGRALDHCERLNVSDAERAGVLTGLGEAAYRAGHPSAINTLHDAAALALRCGADATLMRAALAIEPGSIRLGALGPQQLAIAEAALERSVHGDTATHARVLAMLARSLVPTSEHERRASAANNALELARNSSDVGLLPSIAPDLLFALWAPGAAKDRLEIAHAAVDIVEQVGTPRQASNLYHAAYTAAVCAGDVDLARLCADRLRSLADEIKEPRVLWLAMLVDGFEATMECRFDDATELIEACYELGEQIGESESFTAYAAQFFTLGSHRGWRGEMQAPLPDALDTTESVERTFEIAFAIADLETGRRDSAQAVIDGAIDRGLDSIPPDFMKSSLLIGLAILAIGLGDAAAAELLLAELGQSADEISYNMAMGQGPISIYTGRLSTIAGRFDEAERYLLDGIAVAERFGWEYHRVAALYGIVENRLAANGGLDPGAEASLDEAERAALAHGIEGWARQIHTLRFQLTR